MGALEKSSALSCFDTLQNARGGRARNGDQAGRGIRPAIHVVEGSGCECCKQWTNYLRENGFQVTSEERFGTLLMQHKIDLGVPIELTSCHTGSVDGYFLEGHVPADDIRRLLRERPEALGLTVPGMPYGSPGMGPETKRDAYDVLLVHRDGTSEVFTRYPEAS